MSRSLMGGVGLAFLLAVSPASADNWAQFRGSNGDGLSKETQLPTEWSKDKNVLWKMKVPGYAWSAPIVWGDKVFVTTAVSDGQKKPSGSDSAAAVGEDRAVSAAISAGRTRAFKFEVYCLSASDGKVLWKQTAADQKPTIRQSIALTPMPPRRR